MGLNRGSDATTARVLVVADWRTDAEAIVAACVERQERSGGDFALLIPAQLHGLDWVGDPAASLPCAYRQLAALAHRADSVGFAFQAAGVGDPDPLAAICDALHEWPADELLLCTHGRRAAVSHPLDIAHRTRRTTGLPVSLARVRASTVRPAGHRWQLLRSRCALDRPHPSLGGKFRSAGVAKSVMAVLSTASDVSLCAPASGVHTGERSRSHEQANVSQGGAL